MRVVAAQVSQTADGQRISTAGGSDTVVSDVLIDEGRLLVVGYGSARGPLVWASTDFGNALLSDSSREARLDGKPADNIIPTSEYGLGLQVIGDWHGHGGEILGWESQVFANPTTGPD